MENKRHLNHVETVRALAALLVAFFHFSAYFAWNPTLTECFSFGAQGVEIFYIISGFIISYSLFNSGYKIKNYFSYLGKRFVRLLPPYIATIILIQLIGVLLCAFLWGCTYDPPLKQIIVNVFFLADLFPQYDWINPIFATLEVEVHFYLLIGLLFPLFLKNKWTLFITAVLIISIGLLTTQYDTFLVNSPYFITGISVFFIQHYGPKPEYILTLFVAVLTLCVYYMWIDLIAACIGAGLLMILPRNVKFLNLTGKISYSYYLVHGLSGGWFLYFTSQTEFAQKNPFLIIFFALVISWIIAFGLYFSIEKISLKISKRIRYSK